MLQAGTVILVLKIAVLAVTALLACSLAALWRANYRLHGRINIVFFVLTLAALLGLEVVARILDPDMFTEHFDGHDSWTALYAHLAFSLPSALLLLVMLPTGLRHKRRLHIGLGLAFLCFWTGTVITGVFFLPHAAAPLIGEP